MATKATKYSKEAFLLVAQGNPFREPQKPTDGGKKKKKKKKVYSEETVESHRFITLDELKRMADKLRQGESNA